jgi:hypothetical protein
MPESNQEPHQPLHRVSPELPTKHRGHFGLIDTHHLRRSRLRKRPLLDGPVDLDHQPRLDQVLFRVWQPEIGKDVPGADCGVEIAVWILLEGIISTVCAK